MNERHNEWMQELARSTNARRTDGPSQLIHVLNRSVG